MGFHNDHLILLPLEHIDGISPGDIVTSRTTPRHIILSESILGRVVNGMGEPIDNKGALVGKDKKALDASSPHPLSREKITCPLTLGIRSIDGVLTCGKGQRVGIFSGSGVGKSVLLGDIANSSDADVNIVALNVAERFVNFLIQILVQMDYLVVLLSLPVQIHLQFSELRRRLLQLQSPNISEIKVKTFCL